MAVDLEALRAYRRQLFQWCAANDHRETLRERRMRHITPDTGQFLLVLMWAMSARTVLEIGTSSGYSTLWLAEGGGSLTLLERDSERFALAVRHMREAGVAGRVTLKLADAAAGGDAGGG